MTSGGELRIWVKARELWEDERRNNPMFGRRWEAAKDEFYRAAEIAMSHPKA